MRVFLTGATGFIGSAIVLELINAGHEVLGQLKPLVIIASPARRLWNRQEVASSEFGAGVLLQANHCCFANYMGSGSLLVKTAGKEE